MFIIVGNIKKGFNFDGICIVFMVFFKGEIYIAFRYVRLEVEGGLNWVDKVGIGVMVANERI